MSPRRIVALLLLAWAVVVLLPGMATAHAALKGSVPSDGMNLDQAPSQVQLTFTEPPDVGSRFEVLGPGDRKVASSGPGMATPLPQDLPHGTYQVVWRVISAADGHLTEGITVFGISQVPGMVQQPEPSPSPIAILGKVLLYLGLVIALGGSIAGLFLYQDLPHPRLLILAPILILAGLLLLGWTMVQAASPASVNEILASTQGRWWGTRLTVTVSLAAAVFLSIRRSRWLAGVGFCAMIIALATVASGHAAAPDSLRWLELVSQSAHVLAIGVWVGGLVWLLIGLQVLGRTRRMVRFSRLALGCLILVMITGLWRAWDELGHVSALWTTGWGQILMVKMSLLLLALGAASHNRWRGIPGDVHSLRLGMRMELGLILGVILATGLLSSLNPGRSFEPVHPTASGSDYAGTSHLTVIMTGTDQLEATLTGPATDAMTLDLLASHGDQPAKEIVLDRTGPGTFQGKAPILATGGRWELDASVTSPSGLNVTIDDLSLTLLKEGGQNT